MQLTHAEKALLLEVLNNYPIAWRDKNKIGKEVDRKELIKKIEQEPSINPEK